MRWRTAEKKRRLYPFQRMHGKRAPHSSAALGGPTPSASSATPRRCCALATSTRDCATAADRRRGGACENGIALALRAGGQGPQLWPPSASAADVAACSADSQLPAGQTWHLLSVSKTSLIRSPVLGCSNLQPPPAYHIW